MIKLAEKTSPAYSLTWKCLVCGEIRKTGWYPTWEEVDADMRRHEHPLSLLNMITMNSKKPVELSRCQNMSQHKPVWAACIHGQRNRRVCVECWEALAEGRVVKFPGKQDPTKFDTEQPHHVLMTPENVYVDGKPIGEHFGKSPVSTPECLESEAAGKREIELDIRGRVSVFNYHDEFATTPQYDNTDAGVFTLEKLQALLPTIERFCIQRDTSIDRRDHQWQPRSKPMTFLNLMTFEEYAQQNGGWRQ